MRAPAISVQKALRKIFFLASCTPEKRAILVAGKCQKIKPLYVSNFKEEHLRWHSSRNSFAVSFSLLLFPSTCSLLSALVCADRQAAKIIELARVRENDLS